MRKSFIFLWTFLLLFGFVVKNTSEAYTPVQLYDQVWRLINTKFVDQTNNDQDWSKWRHKYDDKILTNEDAYVAINTMIASLNDPYTKFLDPKEFEEETSSIKGSLKGIGIQIGVKDGKLMVIAPIEDTPAEKAGLLADDEILEIDGKSTKGITVDKAADQIRGEEGTQVTLLIKRKDTEPKSYTITRAEIEVKSVSQKTPYEVKLPDNIGYIRLSSFISRNAAKEFSDIRGSMVSVAINDFELSGGKTIDGMIIGISDNDGQYILGCRMLEDNQEIADYVKTNYNGD